MLAIVQLFRQPTLIALSCAGACVTDTDIPAPLPAHCLVSVAFLLHFPHNLPHVCVPFLSPAIHHASILHTPLLPAHTTAAAFYSLGCAACLVCLCLLLLPFYYLALPTLCTPSLYNLFCTHCTGSALQPRIQQLPTTTTGRQDGCLPTTRVLLTLTIVRCCRCYAHFTTLWFSAFVPQCMITIITGTLLLVMPARTPPTVRCCILLCLPYVFCYHTGGMLRRALPRLTFLRSTARLTVYQPRLCAVMYQAPRLLTAVVNMVGLWPLPQPGNHYIAVPAASVAVVAS